MKKTIFILILLLLNSCANVFEPISLYEGEPRASSGIVRVMFPAEIDLLAIDGQDVSKYQPLLTYGATEYHVLPGARELTVRYRKRWKINTQKDEVIESEAKVVRIDGAPGETFQIFPPALEDYQSARQYSEKFKVSVNKIPAASVAVAPAASIERAQGNIGSQGVVERQAIAAASSSGGLSSFELLKFWWKQADSSEREAFRSWSQG